MTQTPQTMTPGRAAFGRLFPAMTMTAAKAEARALGVTVRPDPLGPCLDGGRLIEVFPLGCGSSAVPASDPAEAVYLARAFYEDSKARPGFNGPSMDSKVRVIVAAALTARGFGLGGVSLDVRLTAGPTASAEVLATVDGPAGVISARFHEFTSRGALALAAEELANTLAGVWFDDAKGLSLSSFDAWNRARFWGLESAYLSALGVNEKTAEAARMAEAFADSARSSGPRSYGVAAEAFRHAAALFRMAGGQTGGHAKRARYQEAAEAMNRRADMAEADSVPAIDPAEGLGFGVETVTESGPVSIGAGVMEPEPEAEESGFDGMAETRAFPTVRHAAEARARCEAETAPRFIDVTPSWSGMVPAFRAILENGTAEGRAVVWAELARMAEIADSAVSAAREAEERAKAEERAEIETARAAEAEAVAALSDMRAPRPYGFAAESLAALDAGALTRAEAARKAAEPLEPFKAPEAQTTAARAILAAEAVKALAAARSAVRAAKRETDKGDNGAGNRAREWQGKAAEAFRMAAGFAAEAGQTEAAEGLTRAANLAAGAASNY